LSKTFCVLPWIHIATRPNGDVRVCCTANASGAGITDNKTAGLITEGGQPLNLRDNTVEEIWNSDCMRQTRLQMLKGDIPTSCTKCFEEESKGIISKRQWETAQWEERLDIKQIVSRTDSEGFLPVNIPYFDLRLGNICQLKCIMCSPHDSSSWIKDWKLQYPKYKNIELKHDQEWNRNYDYTWYQKGSFLDTMRSQSDQIKELYFAGGEPLLIPEHYKILEFMVESGAAKNCMLRYNSNGVELPDKLFDLWNHFKEVRFNFSIDAVGDKNYYIRYPSEWNTVVQNLQRLDQTQDNIIVNIACAVQILNVLYLTEFAEWKINQRFKKIHSHPKVNGVIGTHLVYLPSYLNVRVLPKHIKELAAEKIRNYTDNPRWLGIVDYMMAEDWSHKLESTVEYLETCDRTRNLDFRKIFSELNIME
jgi:MoaA/NifB/PqqE/SkfB family radical SAM enzyme